jgi:hypothetical protein
MRGDRPSPREARRPSCSSTGLQNSATGFRLRSTGSSLGWTFTSTRDGGEVAEARRGMADLRNSKFGNAGLTCLGELLLDPRVAEDSRVLEPTQRPRVDATVDL